MKNNNNCVGQLPIPYLKSSVAINKLKMRSSRRLAAKRESGTPEGCKQDEQQQGKDTLQDAFASQILPVSRADNKRKSRKRERGGLHQDMQAQALVRVQERGPYTSKQSVHVLVGRNEVLRASGHIHRSLMGATTRMDKWA